MTNAEESKIQIWVTSSFVGWHHWPKAPAAVAYLRKIHRHVFHVKAWFDVRGDDRELEFHLMQAELNRVLTRIADGMGPTGTSSYSCEQIGKTVLTYLLKASKVEVSEDGEFGATVTR